MKFIIIYKNEDSVRNNAEALLLDAIARGYDFSKTPASGPKFKTSPIWPSKEEIDKLPLDHQVELVEFLSKPVSMLRSLHKIVIDIESARS